jgi:antibiotic biosynthesis monooxygenase (ABM) superfamily enzyme
MTTISAKRQLVTLINVFTVAPEHQQELVDILITATTSVMNKQPGYISANIHKSLEGTRVTNYAQWESIEAFEAIAHNPEVVVHMRAASALATADFHLYEVVFTDGSE